MTRKISLAHNEVERMTKHVSAYINMRRSQHKTAEINMKRSQHNTN